MSVAVKSLPKFVETLPPDIQEEVRDFAEFLVQKRRPKARQPLRQTWAGALRQYRNQYTSLELQKKSLEWRGTDVSA
jgi:hypothetical protein